MAVAVAAAVGFVVVAAVDAADIDTVAVAAIVDIVVVVAVVAVAIAAEEIADVGAEERVANAAGVHTVAAEVVLAGHSEMEPPSSDDSDKDDVVPPSLSPQHHTSPFPPSGVLQHRTSPTQPVSPVLLPPLLIIQSQQEFLHSISIASILLLHHGQERIFAFLHSLRLSVHPLVVL